MGAIATPRNLVGCIVAPGRLFWGDILGCSVGEYDFIGWMLSQHGSAGRVSGFSQYTVFQGYFNDLDSIRIFD